IRQPAFSADRVDLRLHYAESRRAVDYRRTIAGPASQLRSQRRGASVWIANLLRPAGVPHGEDTQARSRLKSRGIETGAVVTDGQPGTLRGPAQRHPSAIRLGVFGDVSQGLFGDAIQSGSGAPGEAGGDSAVDV